jgi:hypothetical protein
VPVYARALINRERPALVCGRVFWGRLVQGTDKPCRGKSQCVEKSGSAPPAKNRVPEKRFSTQRKMFRAAFSDDFLYHALFG